jgi:hypothetical protein
MEYPGILCVVMVLPVVVMIALVVVVQYSQFNFIMNLFLDIYFSSELEFFFGGGVATFKTENYFTHFAPLEYCVFLEFLNSKGITRSSAACTVRSSLCL